MREEDELPPPPVGMGGGRSQSAASATSPSNGPDLGALLGGLIIGLVEPIASRYGPPGVSQIAPYAILLLVLIFRPGGLFSQTQKKKV